MTETLVPVDEISAGASVLARLRLALVDVNLTLGTREARTRTLAAVPVQLVHARAAVQTRGRLRHGHSIIFNLHFNTVMYFTIFYASHSGSDEFSNETTRLLYINNYQNNAVVNLFQHKH